MIQEKLHTTVSGHVQISDRATGEVLVDKYNAISPKNMATAIARGLANSANFQIFKMKLGNRGTYIDGTQQIVFNPPNVGTPADEVTDLYNATYYEIVDEGNVGADPGNSVVYTNIPASTNTRVIVTCVVSANQAADNPSDTNNIGQIEDPVNSDFFFDELGLFTEGIGTPSLLDETDELMLSHLIFSPIEHTGNRELVIVYTLTISVS